MQMVKYYFMLLNLTAITLLPALTYADKLDEICKKQLCRKPFTVSLQKQDGTHFEMFFERVAPIVSNGWISVFPGETLYIEAEPQGQGLGNFRAVEKNSNPDKTLVFEFKQDEGRVDMLLKVHNPFDQELKFHTVMMLTDSDKMLKTSSCSIITTGDLFEHWPHEIFQLLFFEFKFLAKGAPMECKF